MAEAYLGDTLVDKCYLGDELIDEVYLGDYLVCSSGYFSMHVQMATGKYAVRPNLAYLKIGGVVMDPVNDINYTNEGNGWWHIWIEAPVNHFYWPRASTQGIETVTINYSQHMTSLASIFWDHITYLKNVDFRAMNISKVTSVSKMFEDCRKMEYCHLGNWDFANLTHVPFMFEDCVNLEYLNLSNWHTGNVIDFRDMFQMTEDGGGQIPSALRHITQINTTAVGAVKSRMFNHTQLIQPDSAARTALMSTAGLDWRHPQIPQKINDFVPTDMGSGSVKCDFTIVTQEDPGYTGTIPAGPITYNLYSEKRREEIAVNINPGDTVPCPTGIQDLVILAINDGDCGYVGITGNTVIIRITQ